MPAHYTTHTLTRQDAQYLCDTMGGKGFTVGSAADWCIERGYDWWTAWSLARWAYDLSKQGEK